MLDEPSIIFLINLTVKNEMYKASGPGSMQSGTFSKQFFTSLDCLLLRTELSKDASKKPVLAEIT